MYIFSCNRFLTTLYKHCPALFGLRHRLSNTDREIENYVISAILVYISIEAAKLKLSRLITNNFKIPVQIIIIMQIIIEMANTNQAI